MYKKTQLSIFLATVMFLAFAIQFNFLGCAGTQSKKEVLTPERRKAIQDSLYKVQKRKLDLLFSLGWEPYKQHNYKKAKKYFKRLVEQDTSGIHGKIVYQALGTCYLQLNQPDSAEWAYKMGIKRNPKSPYPYKALGYIYRAQQRTDEAIEMYKKLIELEPDSASYYRHLGELYVKAGEQDKAIDAYQKAVELDPNNKQSQEVLSTLLAQTGDMDRIIAQQKTLVERYPNEIKYRLDLAQSYHKTGDFTNAIEQLKLVIAKEPNNIFALELLGDSYQQTNKFLSAAKIYKHILQINPKDKKNLCNLALTYTSLGKYTTAMRAVRKALAIDPHYGLAYITRGTIYETAAEKCINARKGGKITFDDKLVYKLAYNEYAKAKRDLEWKTEAEKHMKYLETMIPTKEDYFMHKGQKRPRGTCYQWIM